VTITEHLQGVRRLFLDTAPVIYFVEKNPAYTARITPVFSLIDIGALQAVTSPITLAECLIHPYRFHQPSTAERFREVIVSGKNVTFAPTTEQMADIASRLRATYNIALPDALQLATAIVTECDVILTNDPMLKRVGEISVLILDEIEAD